MNSIEKRILLISAIVYTVGVIGFSMQQTRSLFISLTPVNIVAAFVLGLVFQKKWSAGLFFGLLFVAACGFFAEYAGVHTGLIFGSYQYGKTLGPGWEGIPFLIGLNWACMVYFSSSLLVKRIRNPWLLALTGALLMTGYDFLLEPTAMAIDMWSWENGIIPFRNYVAWFVFSFVFIRMFLLMVKPEFNRVASGLFLLQAAFFGVLYFVL